MRRWTHIAIALLLPLCLMAQEQPLQPGAETQQQDAQSAAKQEKKEKKKIFTGFSGGMMVHLGYAFSSSPDEMFRNGSLKDVANVSDLPKDGVTLGIGGAARVHLIDHIHLGMEGYVSTMPLMKSGSNIRTGWGGVLCDFFFKAGKVIPMVGMTIGGGSMNRLYVPSNAETVTSGTSELNYNSSYTKTPFFFIDPYIGLEFGLTSRISMITRIDYLLPFGKKGSTLSGTDVSWSNFITPSGPRLYLGFMFGH